MSIQTQIDRIDLAVSNAFSAVSDKGGSVPDNRTSDDLETAIRSISTSSGMYAFYVDESGHLICVYDTQEAPPFSIEEGHLIYTYAVNPPPLSIDENGHLIWTVEG